MLDNDNTLTLDGCIESHFSQGLRGLQDFTSVMPSVVSISNLQMCSDYWKYTRRNNTGYTYINCYEKLCFSSNVNITYQYSLIDFI